MNLHLFCFLVRLVRSDFWFFCRCLETSHSHCFWPPLQWVNSGNRERKQIQIDLPPSGFSRDPIQFPQFVWSSQFRKKQMNRNLKHLFYLLIFAPFVDWIICANQPVNKDWNNFHKQVRFTVCHVTLNRISFSCKCVKILFTRKKRKRKRNCSFHSRVGNKDVFHALEYKTRTPPHAVCLHYRNKEKKNIPFYSIL